MVVNSSQRGIGDEAGCYLVINNTTDITVEIHTYFDKQATPRLAVESAKGQYAMYEH